jgi:hypothetical protein
MFTYQHMQNLREELTNLNRKLTKLIKIEGALLKNVVKVYELIQIMYGSANLVDIRAHTEQCSIADDENASNKKNPNHKRIIH